MPKSDPLVDALDNLTPTGKTQQLKVLVLFGEQPDVLDAIRRAHARRLSAGQIADALTRQLPAGESISESSVRTWLKSEKLV